MYIHTCMHTYIHTYTRTPRVRAVADCQRLDLTEHQLQTYTTRLQSAAKSIAEGLDGPRTKFSRKVYCPLPPKGHCKDLELKQLE